MQGARPGEALKREAIFAFLYIRYAPSEGNFEKQSGLKPMEMKSIILTRAWNINQMKQNSLMRALPH